MDYLIDKRMVAAIELANTRSPERVADTLGFRGKGRVMQQLRDLRDIYGPKPRIS